MEEEIDVSMVQNSREKQKTKSQRKKAKEMSGRRKMCSDTLTNAFARKQTVSLMDDKSGRTKMLWNGCYFCLHRIGAEVKYSSSISLFSFFVFVFVPLFIFCFTSFTFWFTM